MDFVAISIDSLDEAKNDYIKDVPGALKNALDSVETLMKEGINVAVTPTISQKNLYEIVDITNHFTGKGIPVWYCLYSYDKSVDTKQLFRIGKANDEFIITDKAAMVDLCNQLMEMIKKNKKILMTRKLLEALRSLYESDKRIWKCQALKHFLVVDHIGRISGCHNHNFAGSIFDLPGQWKSKEFKALRKTYHDCTQCNYLCYVAYSLYGSLAASFAARDQWRNAGYFQVNHNSNSKSKSKFVKNETFVGLTESSFVFSKSIRLLISTGSIGCRKLLICRGPASRGRLSSIIEGRNIRVIIANAGAMMLVTNSGIF